MNIIKKINCKIWGHAWIAAGSCPHTGKTYNICSECGKTISI